MSNARKTLRRIIAEKGLVPIAGCYDVLSVKMAERAGFQKERVPELANMLEKAPPKARRALSVFHQRGMTFFLNTRAILVATKRDRPRVQKAFSFARRIVRK